MASIGRAGASAFEIRTGLRLDPYLVAATLILLTFGLMSLYSKSVSFDHGQLFRRQVLNTVIGIVPFALFFFVHPKVWQRGMPWVYALNLAALLAVKLFGKSVKGAERWVEIGPLQFQPSEIAKLLVVLTLAAFYASRQDRIERPSTFVLGFLHAAAPMALIVWQPHLGATIVVLVIWFALSVVARVPARYLAVAAGAAAMLAGLVVTVPSISQKFLHGYQLGRLQGMAAKGADIRGKNWQTDRAEIAFGVGGVLGTGYLKGQQKAGRFIPEQQNDFIFTVIGEEGGLVGCTLLLMAYAFFFYRIWLAMVAAEDPFYRLVATGVFTALFFHAFVNMAMVLQLLPVVGLWLPFLSSGGTAIWLCLACVGLVLNLRRHEPKLLF